MGHTEGEWEATEVKTSCGRAFKIDVAGQDNKHGLIACIYDDATTLNTKPHEEHEANARLICAAPKLKTTMQDIMKLADKAIYADEAKRGKILNEIAFVAEQALAEAGKE